MSAFTEPTPPTPSLRSRRISSLTSFLNSGNDMVDIDASYQFEDQSLELSLMQGDSNHPAPSGRLRRLSSSAWNDFLRASSMESSRNNKIMLCQVEEESAVESGEDGGLNILGNRNILRGEDPFSITAPPMISWSSKQQGTDRMQVEREQVVDQPPSVVSISTSSFININAPAVQADTELAPIDFTGLEYALAFQATTAPSRPDPCSSPTFSSQPPPDLPSVQASPALPLPAHASEHMPPRPVMAASVDPSIGIIIASTSKSPKKPSKSARGPDYTPRPPNAWIIYRSEQIRVLKADAASSQTIKKPQSDISKYIGLMWRDEGSDVRDWYEQQAEIKKQEHRLLYPDYKYCPVRKSLKVTKDPSVPKQKKTPVAPKKKKEVVEGLVGKKIKPAAKKKINPFKSATVTMPVRRTQSAPSAMSAHALGSGAVPSLLPTPSRSTSPALALHRAASEEYSARYNFIQSSESRSTRDDSSYLYPNSTHFRSVTAPEPVSTTASYADEHAGRGNREGSGSGSGSRVNYSDGERVFPDLVAPSAPTLPQTPWTDASTCTSPLNLDDSSQYHLTSLQPASPSTTRIGGYRRHAPSPIRTTIGSHASDSYSFGSHRSTGATPKHWSSLGKPFENFHRPKESAPSAPIFSPTITTPVEFEQNDDLLDLLQPPMTPIPNSATLKRRPSESFAQQNYLDGGSKRSSIGGYSFPRRD